MGKYKLLVTGKNTVILDDIFNQCALDYNILSSSIRYEDLENHVDLMHPDILLIGLNAESRDEMLRFKELKRKLPKPDVQVILVGEDEECKLFRTLVPELEDLVLLKPITVAKIKESMTKHMEELEKALDAERIAQEEAERKAAEEYEKNRRRHILVVDDDTIMLKGIKENLIDKYDVATAISGKVALKFLESKKTDLILLDYEMPGMSGAEVLEAIRQNPEKAETPVVFLTGVSDRDRITKVLAQKPQGYLIKPVDGASLLEKIKSLIG